MNDSPESKREASVYFHDATIEHEGRTYTILARDCQKFAIGSSAWHGPGDPSSWLAVEIFREARRIVGEAGDGVAMTLAAKALGITEYQLYNAIEWHENYMRWHDGDSSYSV